MSLSSDVRHQNRPLYWRLCLARRRGGPNQRGKFLGKRRPLASGLFRWQTAYPQPPKEVIVRG